MSGITNRADLGRADERGPSTSMSACLCVVEEGLGINLSNGHARGSERDLENGKIEHLLYTSGTKSKTDSIRASFHAMACRLAWLAMNAASDVDGCNDPARMRG